MPFARPPECGYQKTIAKQITDAEGDDVLAVKENHKTLHRRITVEMDDLIRAHFKDTWHDHHEHVDAGHGPENVSRLRRLALNLLKGFGPYTKRKSIKGRRKIAGWDHQFLLNLIAG